VHTDAERMAARQIILSAMAADIAESTTEAAPATHPAPPTAPMHGGSRISRGLAGLGQGLWQLLSPAAGGLAMRGARLAAVPLLALVVIGTVWTGTLLHQEQAPASLRDNAPSAVPALDRPQAATRGLAVESEADHAGIRPVPGRQAGGSEEALRAKITEAEKSVGPTQPVLPGLLVELADLCSSQARWSEAGALYERAVAIRERTSGPGDPGTLEIWRRLTVVYRAQGRNRDADEALQRALGAAKDAQRPN
jgi:hypothetical protein